jgi:predicted nucleic acid-binding protein
MFYLDSSVLVCMFSNEVRTSEVQAWRATLKDDDVWISDWNLTEFNSAMSFKRRTAQMSLVQRQEADVLFAAYIKRFPNVVKVSTLHFHRAAEIAGREDINIRAADALHLAIAEANAATVCTLDNKMQHAAGVLEIACFAP